MINTSLQKAFLRHNCKSSRLSRQDKTTIIEQINNDGIFQLKGAVGKGALKLRISEPTVYRYFSRNSKK